MNFCCRTCVFIVEQPDISVTFSIPSTSQVSFVLFFVFTCQYHLEIFGRYVFHVWSNIALHVVPTTEIARYDSFFVSEPVPNVSLTFNVKNLEKGHSKYNVTFYSRH